MPQTYQKIATTTVASNQSQVTFSNIPQTYTDLVCVWRGTTGAAINYYMIFNNDTGGTSYNYRRVFAEGTAVSFEGDNNTSFGYCAILGTTQSSMVASVFNYSSAANVYSSYICRSMWSPYVATYQGVWKNTSAITSITFGSNTTTNTGTVISIYGIKAA